MADHEGLDEDEKAARAREFRTNINRKRSGARKRYSVGYVPQQAGGGGFEQSNLFSSSFDATFARQNMNTPDGSVDGFTLGSLGVPGNPIYREVTEKESLSKVKNFVKKVIPQPIRYNLAPPTTRGEWKTFIFVHLPVLHWLWLYRPKQLIGDLIAGITIGVTHIPQGIGFALLASLPPVYGLYSSFIPVILYSILGSSQHISVGTFPVVALMTGTAIVRLTHDETFTLSLFNGTCNGTDPIDIEDPCGHPPCEALSLDIALTLSLLVGILMIIMSLLKLGFITLFLSDSLVSGYTAAAAFTILVTQIKFLFGLDGDEAAVPSGIAITPRRVIRFCELIFTGHVKGSAIVTSIICILMLVSLDYVNSLLRKYVRKIPVHIPAQLIVVIVATVISFLANLSTRFDLPVIDDLGGILPGRCFGVTVPRLSLARDLISDAFIIAIISFVINISQAKLLAKKNNYSVYPDQEFLAYGVMNLGGSFFGSFPTAGALSRTILQDATGGQTQLVGFISSGIVLLVILFLGSLFGPLPNAALAAIVVVALKGLYLQVRDIYKYFKLSWTDMCVWIVVFLATLLIGLDIGLGIGVLFSLFVVVLQTILPYSPSLGETRAWHYPPEEKLADENFDEEELKVYKVPNIYIYQFNAPLYFANVGVFRSRLYLETGINPSELTDKKEKGIIQQACHKCCCIATDDEKTLQLTKDVQNGAYTRFENSATASGGEEESEPSKENIEYQLEYHTIVIDCTPIGFTDSMGVSILELLVKEFDGVGVQILLASPPTPLCLALNRHGFFKRFSSERLFPTVSTAVGYAKDGHRVPALEAPEEPDISLASNLERQLLYSARPSLLDKEPIELERRGRTQTTTVPRQVEETESTV